MSIVLQGSTSGSVTLQEPAVSGSTVLSLPNVSGTLITTGSSGQSIPKAALPAGAVLQVVSASTTTQVSNSTTTYVDTGLSATITPSSASSRILVIVTQNCYKSAGNAGNGVNIKLFRNATDLGRMVHAQSYSGTAIEFYSIAAFQNLDTPATTSSVTYKTQFANETGASLVSVQSDNIGRSTITLLEIAA
jgi:hypothetical protein